MAGRKKRSEAGSAERAPWSVVVKAVFKDAIVLDPGLPAAALRVGLRLMHYFDMDGMWRAYPSIGTLAADLKLTEEGGRRGIKRLEENEWFTVIRSAGGRADGYGGRAPYQSNSYVPRWFTIYRYMPERWQQLEKLARDKGPGSEPIEQDPSPNGRTGMNADLSPNAGWGMKAGEPPTGVGRNPQQPLGGTPNGSTPNLPYITPRKELPDAAARPASVSFDDRRSRGSAANANSRTRTRSGEPKEDIGNLPPFFDGPTDIGSALRGEAGPKPQRRDTSAKAGEKPRPQAKDWAKDGRF